MGIRLFTLALTCGVFVSLAQAQTACAPSPIVAHYQAYAAALQNEPPRVWMPPRMQAVFR
jgi:hypothetical protein